MSEPSSSCPFCRCEVGFDEDVVACPECRVLYHKGCWEENAGCARYGCEGKMDDDRGKIVIRSEDLNALPASRPTSEPLEEPTTYYPPLEEDDSSGFDCGEFIGCLFWVIVIIVVVKSCS